MRGSWAGGFFGFLLYFGEIIKAQNSHRERWGRKKKEGKGIKPLKAKKGERFPSTPSAQPAPSPRGGS